MTATDTNTNPRDDKITAFSRLASDQSKQASIIDASTHASKHVRRAMVKNLAALADGALTLLHDLDEDAPGPCGLSEGVCTSYCRSCIGRMWAYQMSIVRATDELLTKLANTKPFKATRRRVWRPGDPL